MHHGGVRRLANPCESLSGRCSAPSFHDGNHDMSWLFLITAGLLEIGWPLGLKYAQQDGGRLAGIAAAVLIVTPEIQQSQFVPAEELPELLKLEQEPHDFSLLVLNTIPTQDETDSNDGRPRGEDAETEHPSTDDASADHPHGGCGRTDEAIDVSAPDRLLKTVGQPLKNLKQ